MRYPVLQGTHSKKIRLAQILRNCYYEVSTKKALRAMQQVSCTRTRESVHARPHYGKNCHILSKNYGRFLIYKTFTREIFELQMKKTNQVNLNEMITDDVNYMDSESKKRPHNFWTILNKKDHCVPLLLTWKYVAASKGQ